MLKRRDSQTFSSRKTDLIVAWGPALLWMAVIFYFSSDNTWATGSSLPTSKVLRKGAHIVEYSVLALLVGQALFTTWLARGAQVSRALLMRVWWTGALFCILYAASDEIHQAFVPRREFHLTDILIDGLSATAALGIWYIVRARERTSNL